MQFINFPLMDLAFGVDSKSSLPAQNQSHFVLFSSRGLIVLHFTFGAAICFESIFEQGVSLDQSSVFCLWTHFCSNTIYWKNYPFPIEFLLHFVKNWLRIFMRLITELIVPLTFVSVLSPITHCLDYYSFKVSLEISYWKSSNFILWLFVSLLFNIYFRVSSWIPTKKSCWDFDWGSLNL